MSFTQLYIHSHSCTKELFFLCWMSKYPDYFLPVLSECHYCCLLVSASVSHSWFSLSLHIKRERANVIHVKNVISHFQAFLTMTFNYTFFNKLYYYVLKDFFCLSPFTLQVQLFLVLFVCTAL